MATVHSKIGSKQPGNILVVDDTPAVLELLAGMLKRRGHKVRPVASGRLALQAARCEPPDLILLDISMPDMSGYELCEHLKSDDKLQGIPVIFISALSEELDKVRAFANGGVDYITKPFQMEELHARVETHLKLRRLQIDLEQYSRNLELAQMRLKLDLEMARGVQRGLLPPGLPQAEGYDFFVHYEPANEVGGDYYDFIPLPGQRVAVVVGDVSGKGVAAALLMAKLSVDTRFCLLTEPDPAVAFNRLNSLIYKWGFADRFVTLLVAIVDPVNHIATILNAGHPSPMIHHGSTGGVESAFSADMIGLPLGIVEDTQYDSGEISLQPGDSILAFTDGVTEAVNDEDIQLQTEGVHAAMLGEVSSTPALGEQVIQVVKQFTSGNSQRDDITLAGFGRTI